ncbi:MAG: methylmalonyl Co-A mutase-associated GTPase MeaB [Candidatus Schekmanbacteria bacterium]|nr:methylmalonyl Co-A mutase-associated GTPase MeaB [Candidatus Schekmanbacteria bacterium]
MHTGHDISGAEVDELAAAVLRGEPRAIGRALTVVERSGEPAERLVSILFRSSPWPNVVGITGPPGAGKSTLVDGLAGAARHRGHRVGIIAVDPTSPFTGGAILGDRVRMLRHSTDPGVFIRSMASRRHPGGLAAATAEGVYVLAAAGFDLVLVETVGVGQSEVAVAELAGTTVVVLVPEGGDAIQVLKAGLMEIADIFVVNKSDREGGDRLVAALEETVDFAAPGSRPAVRKTVATVGEGVDRVLDDILAHQLHLVATGAGRRRRERTLRLTIQHLLTRRALRETWFPAEASGLVDALIEQLLQRALSPYEAVERLLGNSGAPA